MARLKYAEGVQPLLNEHQGFTFQPNRYGQSVLNSQKNDKRRNIIQNLRMQNLQKAIQQWKNMGYVTQNNWNNFASTYPQASRRNPAVFLSGYQLFLKRMSYCFLNYGIENDFLTEPKLEALDPPEISFSIEQNENVVDCTENYIARFGVIPAPGQFVLIKIYPMSTYSAQFFEPIEQIIEVTESFIDGIFVSLHWSVPPTDVTFSIYLSKVFHQSTNYVGTKCRYMGCFTTKKFLELTDTPDSYEGNAGKVPVVNDDETGLEFSTPGGGGLTCKDLPECPTIISINDTITAIAGVLVPIANISIPAVKYGLLYNWFTANNTLLLPPGGWRVPTFSDFYSNLITYAGGLSVSGGKLKEIGTEYWTSPNTGAVNYFGFNCRPGGRRLNTGEFSTIDFNSFLIRLGGETSSSYNLVSCVYNSGATSLPTILKQSGHSIRLCRNATGVVDGIIGTCQGNNGRVYRTITINGLEWMTDNLCETLLNDLTVIPEITDNSEWAALTSPALCAYNNDWTNV